MENIVVAKRELYNTLKLAIEEVTGAGIKNKNGEESIVIFVSNNTQRIMEQIPLEFKGNRVMAEVRSLVTVW